MTKVKKPQDLEQEIARLRNQSIEAVQAGDLKRALELAIEVEDRAAQLGDQFWIDLASCERAGAEIHCGNGETAVKSMRKLLFRSNDPEIRSRAAYNVAICHFDLDENERALFYSKQALHYADECVQAKLLIWSHNLIGRIQAKSSNFQEARAHYAEALELLPEAPSAERATALSNLGYVLAVLGRTADAFRVAFKSQRMMIALKAGPWQRLPHLVLSFAYLEIGRYDRGLHHARRALDFARQAPDGADHEKNALYLLGEAEKLCGLDGEAYEHICELQRRFYPDQPFVVDVLLSTDVRKLVNLMA